MAKVRLGVYLNSRIGLSGHGVKLDQFITVYPSSREGPTWFILRDMAKKTETIVTLTDDLDGSKADRTMTFTIEGSRYEIELSKKNATAFEKALQPYLSVARKVRGSSRAKPARPKSELSAVREWAQGNKLKVSARGRISQAVLDAYEAAH